MVLSFASVALSTLWRSPMPGFTTVFETLFDLFFLPLPLFLPFPFLFFFHGVGEIHFKIPNNLHLCTDRVNGEMLE